MSSADIRARTALLVLVGLIGVDSVIGAPAGGPVHVEVLEDDESGPGGARGVDDGVLEGRELRRPSGGSGVR